MRALFRTCTSTTRGNNSRASAPPAGVSRLSSPTSTVRLTLGLVIGVVVAVVVIVVAGDAVLAAPAPGGPAPGVPPTEGLSEVMDRIRLVVVGLLAALATLFLTLGGARYLTASEPGDAEKAKSSFRNAGIGYGLAILAPVLFEILKWIVGAK